MSDRLKIILTGIIILIFVVSYFLFNQEKDKANKGKEEAARFKVKELTQQIVKKYNANTTLYSRLDTISSYFSICIQKEFQQNLGSPFLIKGTLKDIYTEKDSAFANFELGFGEMSIWN